MYKTVSSAALGVATLLTGLILSPSAAWAERPQCMGRVATST